MTEPTNDEIITTVTDDEIIKTVADERFQVRMKSIPHDGPQYSTAQFADSEKQSIIAGVRANLAEKRKDILKEYEEYEVAKGKRASESQKRNINERRNAFVKFMGSKEGKALENEPGFFSRLFSAKRTPEQESAIAEYKDMKTAYAAGANVGPILEKLKGVGLKKGGARRKSRRRHRSRRHTRRR
jgi:hypothetical protein